MTKPERQIIIDFIVSCLRKGEQRGKILVKTGKKWGTSKSAFDRLLKIAKEQQTGTQQAIKKAKEALDLQNELENHKDLIADVQERKEILTKIMRGQIQLNKPMIVDGQLELIPMIPDWMDRKNAIAELNKMDGEYAANKVQITGNLQTSQLSDTQFQQLLKEARESKNSSGQ